MLSRRNNAFTLTELMVCIGIVAILAAILIPVIVTARNSARQSSCLSNQRQAALALRLYADDYNGDFPTALGIEDVSAVKSKGYNPATMGCPSVTPQEAQQCKRGMLGYAVNFLLLADAQPHFDPGAQVNPEKLVLICEEPINAAWTSSLFPEGVTPGMFQKNIGVNRHSGGSNITYIDGHSHWMRPEGWYESADNTHFETTYRSTSVN